MPRPLRNRLQPDSPAEFRSAARQRFVDGEVAAFNDRRTVAIYLWGYSAEMILKAAYFSLIGFGEYQEIKLIDLRGAQSAGKNYGIAWPGALHNVQAWAELLVKHRSTLSGVSPHSPLISRRIRLVGRQIYHIWSETLRYHPNRAYEYEVEITRQATAWLLDHHGQL